MRAFIALCVLILNVNSAACMSDEGIHRNREEFHSFESPSGDVSSPHDKHATNVLHISRRNSFLPLQSSSNYFRDLISRSDGANDNTNEYTVDPAFTSFLQQKQRKQQSEIHRSALYRMTKEVQVKQGRLTGIVREMNVQSRLKDVDQFLGIPYAEAPIGSRRFMPPSSPLPWTDVKRANKMEAVCPQKLPNLNDPNGYNKGRYDQIKRLLPYLKRESEDCLYLNLYVTSQGELWEGMFDKLRSSLSRALLLNYSFQQFPRLWRYFKICFDGSTRILFVFWVSSHHYFYVLGFLTNMRWSSSSSRALSKIIKLHA